MGHFRQEPFGNIAYPRRRKRRSNPRQIPVPPPPSLADEITRAEPMSTYNALANEPKKGTKLLYEKYWDSCMVEVNRGNNLTTHLVWQILLSQVITFPTSI